MGKVLGDFKLIQNKEIYSDDKGKLVGWEQKNNTIVLFAGAKETKYIGDLDCISFPAEAAPDLIDFLQSITLPGGRGLKNLKVHSICDIEGITLCGRKKAKLSVTENKNKVSCKKCRLIIDQHDAIVKRVRFWERAI